MLGVEEIFVIGHEDCGMADINEEKLKVRMLDRGISIEVIERYVPDLANWLGAFACPEENVSRWSTRFARTRLSRQTCRSMA